MKSGIKVGDHLRRGQHSADVLECLSRRNHDGKVIWLCRVLTGPDRGDVLRIDQSELCRLPEERAPSARSSEGTLAGRDRSQETS